MEFTDLPLELLTQILSHLVKAQYLASACRVNKTFHQFGIPKLYEWASIYAWHKHGKAKVVSLFTTLSRCPHLAKYVLKLEIRDFPKSLVTADLTENLVLAGLNNCANLQACTWTRDGSLNSPILTVLHGLNTLRELEINGNSEGHYDAQLLPNFTHMQRISLIMPSARVVGQLNSWMALTGPTLRSLTLICKMSPLVTDAVLESLAPNLVHLDQFSIAGCPRVGPRGIWAVISQNITGIRVLGLEGLGNRFDIHELSTLCVQSTAFAHLTSFTISLPQHADTWLASISAMLSSAPLEIFQIYATLGHQPSFSAESLWRDIVTVHGARLTRFSVHRMLVSMDTITDICTRCTALRQLFIVLEYSDLDQLANCLSHAPKIQAVHVNLQQHATDDGHANVLKAPDALAIVRRCPPTLTLFGCNARVWQVERQVKWVEARGEFVVERFLAKYDQPDIPEQFLVVRT
ncbi:hypothetical protein C8J57DRAFT_1508112 [Mycena rebaudengoi]|nr:hypothetical protein C8J57DRAFT_1508112 [Mycena rebaudengoi]